MLQTWVVVVASALYLGLLFAVAFYGDRRADAGRSLISSGTIYALSLAVYATSWTYYGSVGRGVNTGVEFLPIYLGPTLMLALGWLVLRRIIRISRRHRITSLADFISARYGKSASLGAMVTVIAVVGVVPYISLQLKAVSNTFEIIRRHPEITTTAQLGEVPVYQDTALYVALLLAGFTILFGARHLDATERHEGMVAAIAFESVVKLFAFVTAGIFVTFGLFGGFGDLFSQAAATDVDVEALFTLGGDGGYVSWVWLTVLSMLAVVLLPRQWQVGVVENVSEEHVKRAMWLFPLYLLLMNIFVLPIATAGLIRLGDSADADTYVLTLPMAEGQQALALLVFLGGLSAATGMIIVETVALSTMVSNSLVMPALLRAKSRLVQRRDVSALVLGIRRATIILILLLGYAYFRLAGEGPGLVSIGLVSFAAVAQFAPAILGGLFWRGGTRNGALAGLTAGFVVWFYTLLLPTFADAGLIRSSFLREGPFGIELLRPESLLGVDGIDEVSHAMFWTMFVNIGAYVAVSLASRPGPQEQAQAVLFVNALADPVRPRLWRERVSVAELRTLLEQFIGPAAAAAVIRAQRPHPRLETAAAEPELVHHVETVLAGSVGAASARLVIASVAGEEQLRVDEVMEMIDEASHVAALEERHRLARELHDSVSQALFSMTLHTRAVEMAVQREGGDPNGRVVRGLRELRTLTQGALAEIRASIFQLRPDALHEHGLAAAVEKHAAAVAAREGLEIAVQAPDDRLPLDDRAEEELFRVVQEALHNSVKHARPTHVDIRMGSYTAEDGALVIEVVDDGVGFDPAVSMPGHLGLETMRERTQRIGGWLTVDSSPDGSTTVRATLPPSSRHFSAAGREP